MFHCITLITTVALDEVAEVLKDTGLQPNTDGELHYKLIAADIADVNGVLCVEREKRLNYAINIFEFRTDDMVHAEIVLSAFSVMFDGSIVFQGELKPPSPLPIPTTV